MPLEKQHRRLNYHLRHSHDEILSNERVQRFYWCSQNVVKVNLSESVREKSLLLVLFFFFGFVDLFSKINCITLQGISSSGGSYSHEICLSSKIYSD